MNVFLWFFSGIILDLSGSFIAISTNSTRGKGSWREDRNRLLVAGACYGISVVCYGLALASIFE